MPLRLRVVGDNAAKLGVFARTTFGVNGGRIGRGLDNDWVLPDTDRFVSTQHAEIHYREGHWIIRDLSTNGTYVNDRVNPLGPGDIYVLKNGDRLQIGQFKIEAEIYAGNDFPQDEGEIDHGETLGLELEEVFGRSAAAAKTAAPASARPRPSTGPAPLPAAPLPAAPTPRNNDPVRPLAQDELDLLPGIAALCRGAGIDPAAFPPATRRLLLQQAGQMLRELVLGLLDLNRSRADFTKEFGIGGLSKYSSGTSPLVRMTGVEEMLTRWLSESAGNARPVDEMRDMFEDARNHERAVAMALRAGLDSLVTRLDPERFEQANAQHAFDTGAPREQVWRRYRDSYKTATRPEQSGVPSAFAEEFAQTYRALAHLKSASDSESSIIKLD